MWRIVTGKRSSMYTLPVCRLGGTVAEGGGHRSKTSPNDVMADPHLQVEEYIKRFGNSLDRLTFMATAVSGLSSFMYDRHRIKHGTCIGPWRWRHGVFDRYRLMLITDASLQSILFVRFEVEVDYC